MRDAAAFHGYLALLSAIWANTQESGSQLEVAYHKVECVRIINSRLNRREPPLEGTIMAIIFLWGLEVQTLMFCKTLIAN
jgi:hypothetical protein